MCHRGLLGEEPGVWRSRAGAGGAGGPTCQGRSGRGHWRAQGPSVRSALPGPDECPPSLVSASPTLSEVEMPTSHSRCSRRGWRSRRVGVRGGRGLGDRQVVTCHGKPGQRARRHHRQEGTVTGAPGFYVSAGAPFFTPGHSRIRRDYSSGAYRTRIGQDGSRSPRPRLASF